MRQASLRTLLVVSERPHPWAFLRDRLDPDMVEVAWTRPAQAGVRTPPWMLAGTGEEAAALRAFQGRLLWWRWVGPAPAGLPVQPTRHQDWHQVATAVEQALTVRLAGVRLAPAGGLVLPDGRYLSGTAGLEALLAAHPGGLDVGLATPRLRAAVRRTAELLQRHRLPLRVAWNGRRLALAESAPEDTANGRPA